MPLKTYDTKDAVPEALRASAVELKDGKFAVSEDDPALGEKGKKALDDERTARKTAEDKLKAAEKERDDLKLKAEAASKGITEAELQKIRDTEAAARKPLEDENARLKAENRKLARDDRLRALGVKAGWMNDRVDKAMKDLVDRVDLTEDGKGFVVKDAKGSVTTESIEDFLGKTYKAEASFYYAGSGGAGGGSEGSSGGGSADDAKAAVAAGKAAAERQKAGREENALAFR